MPTAMPAPRVRVYIACSLDGFIAGPNDDLSWLDAPTPADVGPPPVSDAIQFEEFMADVGALVMGRRTHDVVAGFGQWPYGDTPVLVATRRELTAAQPSVRRVEGDIGAVLAQARQAAAGKDVYLDGGALIRQALNAGLVDELILTMVPILLGEGVRLFDGLERRLPLELVAQHRFGHDKVQLVLRPETGEG